MALTALTPAQILGRIRYDSLTKKGSVFDVIRLVTDQENPKKLLDRMTAQVPEVLPNWEYFKFPGQGQRPTPVAYLKDLIEIAWLCPGKHAKEFRRTGAVTLCRALGGDLSLVDEIKERHGEVTEAEQEALLAGTGVSVAEANGQAIVSPEEERARVRKLNAEAAMMEAEVDRVRTEAMRARAEASVATCRALLDIAGGVSEGRDRLFYNDLARNFAQCNLLGFPATDGRSPDRSSDAQITISTVAVQMGVRLDGRALVRAGKKASSLYRARYGESPPKHEQFCDGRVILANTYTERDRDLVEEAIRATWAEADA